jgi:hypothetical protein
MEDVEVMAVELYKIDSNNQEEKASYFPSLNLAWAHYVNPVNPNLLLETMSAIQPGLFKSCSIGYLAESRYIESERLIIRESSKVVFILSSVISPNSGEHILYPNHQYKLKIMIAGNNLKPREEIFHLMFIDRWPDDEKQAFNEIISLKKVQGSM